MTDFDIRDYLDHFELVKEYSTYREFKCPVCQQTRFNITKKKGLYKCWKNGCSAKSIIKAAGIKVKQKPKSPFSIPSPFTQARIIKPIKVEPPITLQFLRVNPEDIKFPSTSSSGFTAYQYDSTHRICRFNVVEDGKQKKILYPSYFCTNQSKWINEEDPAHHRSLISYRENDIPLITNIGDGNCLIFTEGEKVADSVMRLGYFATSPAGSCWNVEDLSKILRRLRDKLKISHVLLLGDNDVTGKRKSETLREECWRLNISYSVEFFGEGGGYDFYDYVQEHKEEDNKMFFENYVDTFTEKE